MLSWFHWQGDLKEFVDSFTSSNGLEASNVLETSQKCSVSKQCDISLMFVKTAGSSVKFEQVLDQLCELLPKVSRDWRYQISSAERNSQKILLRLSRPGICIGSIQTIMNMASEENTNMLSPVTVYLDTERDGSDPSLTAERLQLVRDVTVRLLRWAGHPVSETDRNDGPPGAGPGALLCVTANSRLELPGSAAGRSDGMGRSDRGEQDGRGKGDREEEGDRGEGDGTEEGGAECRLLRRDCGDQSSVERVVVEPVVNLKTGKKELDVTSVEFRRRREAALLSAGQSRQRGCSAQQAALMARASVAHQLLTVSISSPCRVRTEETEAASPADGAVFALYNAARLQAVLDRFEAEVTAGTYPPLPTVSQIGHEFHRLATEDEWTLVWHHLLPFPCLLHSCACGALVGRPALHRLCAGLAALSRAFSRYYSRTHVLTPPREHLMSTLHVRIHLLKAVQVVFATYFHLLGYEPLERV